MSKIDAKEIYRQFKYGERAYKEEIHCPMILEVMNEEGTMTAFCKKAQIHNRLFYKWLSKNPVFKDCYEYGKILSKCNWDEEGEKGKDEDFFNFEYWRIKGAQRYGVGQNRVRMGVDPDSNPYEQYKQLIEMANSEEFSASELKQVSETLNVGRLTFESFKLQEQVNKITEDVQRMGLRNANNSLSIEKATETD